MTWKYFLPALLVAGCLVTGCTKIQEPVFRRIEKFKVKNIGLTKGTIGFNITYYNPNTFGLTVKQTEADVSIDSIFLGRFTQDILTEVPPKSEFSIPISGTIPIGKVLQLDLPNLAYKDIYVKAVGSTQVGKMGVYITKQFTYSGLHRLDEIRL
jgi:LEA14-like dessication related protein